ncbi:hypothetical protein NRK68_01455 [Streptomyces yangpuensis]|uniref:Uncharacterized protein n=1 Tax=Streptomyces yangpuensis TaxID=1648182 RepID=A0ABY5PPH8_9ACTN|nr:hypothetical protein [Streptomyces yangpuensis]UUY45996.1 hypothetical protein NRK68_01455 [Streptomyces yangpuensis]
MPSLPSGAARCGAFLLPDLRVLQLGDAAGNSLCREALAQAARAARDERSLEPAPYSPPALRRLRWTKGLIKNLSPRTLTGQ